MFEITNPVTRPFYTLLIAVLASTVVAVVLAVVAVGIHDGVCYLCKWFAALKRKFK